MAPSTNGRIAGASALTALAAFPPYVALAEWIRIHSKSDAQLLAQFQGAAWEDIFGFGFWVTVAVLAVFEFLLLAALLAIARDTRLRLVVVLLAALSITSFAMFYFANAREDALWQLHVQQRG